MASKSAGLQAILARLPTSMNDLLGPVTNRGVQGDLPALLEAVDNALPAGTTRQCLHAALWLLADDLDHAHQICQAIETPHAAAWHAIVHRREGDFWNSKYWWRRAAPGVQFDGLSQAIQAQLKEPPPEVATWLRSDRYDAPGFVDLVERFADRTEFRDALVAVQRLEWSSLFQECWNA